MQLAILHHHLNRGGVTSVIVNQLRALATLPAAERPERPERPERVVVLYDGQRDGWPETSPEGFPIELVIEPALAYDRAAAAADPAGLAATLAARLAENGLTADTTLLQVHNHALGKNVSLPGALRRLADGGWRMLLQVHDFAEDNRPDNYRHLQVSLSESDPDRLGGLLYPQAPGVHYATLTERDADLFRAAGVAAERLHTLPNPVSEFSGMPPREEARSRVLPALGLPKDAQLVVYPVRGIRRKNLGEMLLLSALAPEGTYFAVTLRPKNPAEAASFDRWRRLADSLDLPCCFDTGGPKEQGGYGCDFLETLAAADAIVTTSVAEGFGMVFLEAWLAGKPLIGRDLPEITREFKAAGMRFRSLWAELRAAESLENDFARLTATEQAEVIQATRRPTVPLDLGIEAAAGDIAANAAVVREHYNTESIGRRLKVVFSAVLADRGGLAGDFHGEAIVEHFADPVRQSPVRVESVASAERDTLSDLITQLSGPLPSEPTGETADLPKLPGVRAVVFDVYGTLLVSGSGDISLASGGARGAAAADALQAVLGEPVADGEAVVAALHAAIHAAHDASPSAHPEVEIRDIWRTVLEGLGRAATDAQIERLAVEYECRVNPIGPMPGLAETLDALRDAGQLLGIVSNAQFFTPLAFAPLTGKSLRSWGFAPELSVWSYEHGEAKPGAYLYERCADALAAHGVAADEALFVGNDLRNDVAPAQQTGFRTALFAGDARSLRWRRDDRSLADVRPDAVVTDLRELLSIVL
ncbi:Phosphoglycolate phosphatase [Botrimarina colliarenosi]|uniref:Phosphoglycolate phosphatase n=1 Tax=Botrimarina colliarenosi TaxID=2528001 RepID=A0A5C6A0M9_9BACT|nr:HAD family hydrolase [Botrimarina colliarenosi]TWT93382.1 Phosphoglycolate phosphatase [Botrimarina colliarenosi]